MTNILQINLCHLGQILAVNYFLFSTCLAQGVSVTLVSMFQSGGGITGEPVKHLLLLPSSGLTKLDDNSIADIFLVVKNESSQQRTLLTVPDAVFTITLFSYSPTIDEIKNMPKELEYTFTEDFKNQPMEIRLSSEDTYIYAINFFNNKQMIKNPLAWLWITGISKIRIDSRLYFDDGEVHLNSAWIPVKVEVPQFNKK